MMELGNVSVVVELVGFDVAVSVWPFCRRPTTLCESDPNAGLVEVEGPICQPLSAVCDLAPSEESTTFNRYFMDI